MNESLYSQYVMGPKFAPASAGNSSGGQVGSHDHSARLVRVGSDDPAHGLHGFIQLVLLERAAFAVVHPDHHASGTNVVEPLGSRVGKSS